MSVALKAGPGLAAEGREAAGAGEGEGVGFAARVKRFRAEAAAIGLP